MGRNGLSEVCSRGIETEITDYDDLNDWLVGYQL